MKWNIHIAAVLVLSYQAVALPSDRLGLGTRDVSSQDHQVPVEVIAYVDQNGHTISVEEVVQATSTITITDGTLANSPTELPPIAIAPDLNLPNELVPALPTDVANPSSHIPTYVDNRRQFGISYSPYSADQTCRSQAQVNSDLDKLTQYAFVRIYGVDCDQTRKVVNAARQRNMKVFAGVYDLQNLEASLDLIIAAAAGDFSIYHTISIGNELINRGKNTVSQVFFAVHRARQYLRRAGYQGPVVTIDTFSQMIEHPILCTASDYCAANCHAFFDANQTPEQAGHYARQQAQRLSSVAGGKRTMISESGWPHRGNPNGRAVPSPQNHRVAIESLRAAFANDPDNLVLFSAFDDLWKTDWSGSFGAEKYWGVESR